MRFYAEKLYMLKKREEWQSELAQALGMECSSVTESGVHLHKRLGSALVELYVGDDLIVHSLQTPAESGTDFVEGLVVALRRLGLYVMFIDEWPWREE